MQKTPLGAVKCSHCHSPAARLKAPCDVFPHIAAVNTALVRNLVVQCMMPTQMNSSRFPTLCRFVPL